MKPKSDNVLTLSKPLTQRDRTLGKRSKANSPNSVLTSTLKYFSLVLACVVVLLPLVVIFMASFKTEQEFYNTPVLSLPSNFLNLQNFSDAFTGGLMLQGFANTAIILVFSCTGTILIGTMTAYVLSRFNFRLNKVVSGLFLLAALIPGVSTQVATFQIISGLGLFNKIS